MDNSRYKFRAWDKTEKSMLDWNELSYMDLHWVLLNLEVMQYTGLKDKNGKEIYEGDVVKGMLTIAEAGCDNMCYDFVGVIIYEAPAFVTDNSDFPLNIYDSLEILGNIYENPELLERVNSI